MENKATTRLLLWLDRELIDANFMEKTAHFVLRLLFITTIQFGKNGLAQRSSAMSYTLLLSLVPMLAMSTAIIKGLGGDDQLKKAAYSYIETLEQSKGFSLPELNFTDEEENITQEKHNEADKGTENPQEIQESLTSYLRTAIDKIFDYAARTNFATLGSFGVIGILFTVLLMLSHVEKAMNIIWKVEEGRSLMRKLSDYLTLIFLLPFSINVTFAATALLRHPPFASKLDILLPFAWLQTLLFQAVPIFFISLSLFIIYIFFPNTKVKNTPAMLGALLAGFFWFIVQNIYINLQVGVAKYNAIYGTFASAPLFLAWLYLGWLFVLIGAQFAWALQNMQHMQLTRQYDKPTDNLSAAFDVCRIVYQQFVDNQPTTEEDLQARLPYSPRLIRTTIDQLTSGDILCLTQENDYLLPLYPQQGTAHKKIVELLLGEEVPASFGGQKSKAVLDAAMIAISKDEAIWLPEKADNY